MQVSRRPIPPPLPLETKTSRQHYPAPNKGTRQERQANTIFKAVGNPQGVLQQVLQNIDGGLCPFPLRSQDDGKQVPVITTSSRPTYLMPLRALEKGCRDPMHRYIVPRLMPKVNASIPVLSLWMRGLDADIDAHEAYGIHRSIAAELFLKRVQQTTALIETTRLQSLTVHDVHRHDFSMLPGANAGVSKQRKDDDDDDDDELDDDFGSSTVELGLGLKNLKEGKKMMLFQDKRVSEDIAREIFPNPLLIASAMYVMDTSGLAWLGQEWESLARIAFHELTSAVYCDPPQVVTEGCADVPIDPATVYFRPTLLEAFDVVVNTLLAGKHKAYRIEKRLKHREKLFHDAHRRFRQNTFRLVFTSWRLYATACRKIKKSVQAACGNFKRDSVVASAIRNWRCVARYKLESRKRPQIQTEPITEKLRLYYMSKLLKNHLSTHEILLKHATQQYSQLKDRLDVVRKLSITALRHTKHDTLHLKSLIDAMCPTMAPEVTPVCDWASFYRDDSVIGATRLFSVLVRDPDTAGFVNRVLREMKHLIPMLRVFVGILVPEEVEAKRLLKTRGIWQHMAHLSSSSSSSDATAASNDPLQAKTATGAGRSEQQQQQEETMADAFQLLDADVADAVAAIKCRHTRVKLLLKDFIDVSSTSRFSAAFFNLFERVVSDTAKPFVRSFSGLPLGAPPILPRSLAHALETDDLDLRRFLLLQLAECIFRSGNTAYKTFSFDEKDRSLLLLEIGERETEEVEGGLIRTHSRSGRDSSGSVYHDVPQPESRQWLEYFRERLGETLKREQHLCLAQEYEEATFSMLERARTQACLQASTKLFETFLAAHPYQTREIRIDFLSVKLQMTFGRDSTFWRSTLISKKMIRTPAEMDDLVATVAMLANVTPTWLIDRLAQSLTDVDTFYVSLVHPATLQCVEEVMDEVSTVFTLHMVRIAGLTDSPGDPPQPRLTLNGWFRIANPWYDTMFDESVAEEIYYRAILKEMSTVDEGSNVRVQLQKSLLLNKLGLQGHNTDGANTNATQQTTNDSSASASSAAPPSSGSASSSSLTSGQVVIKQVDHHHHHHPNPTSISSSGGGGGGSTLDSVVMSLEAFATALVIATAFKIPNPMIQMERKIKPFVFTWLLPLGMKGAGKGSKKR